MKFARMLILALGLVTLATASSFASITLNTTTSPTVINTDAQTGLVGNISLTPSSPGNITAGEVLTIQFPTNVPISYLTDVSVSMTGTNGTAVFKTNYGSRDYCPSAGVGFVTASNGNTFSTYGNTFTTATTGANAGAAVTVNQYSIVIAFNAANINFGSADFIQINGVRMDPVNVSSGSGATISVSFNDTTGGQVTFSNSPLVVASFVAGTNIMTGYYSNGLNFRPDGTAIQNLVTVTLKELFPNAWETKTTSYNTYTRVKLALTIPSGQNGVPLYTVTGVNLANDATATFANGQYATGGVQNGILTQLPTILVGVSSQSATINETLNIGITFGVTTGQIMPSTPPSITITALLNPPATVDGTDTGTALAYPFNRPSNVPAGYVQQAQLKYRPTASPVSLTVPVSLAAPQTSNLLSIYNTVYHSTGSSLPMYDTGIAITNLSGSNPTTTNYPVATPGAITVYFYPMDGSGPFSVSTNSSSMPASAKSGLDSNGALPSKGTWTALLSQLLLPAGFSPTANFQGFVRFKCNFPESTGVAYIGDGGFSSFAVGFQMQSDVPVTITGGTTIVPPVF